MPKKTGYAVPPQRSFATDYKLGMEQSATKSTPGQTTPRAKRRNAQRNSAPKYPWPEAFVGMKLDPKGAKDWRRYGRLVEDSARNIGEYVGTANLALVLISPGELHAALNERYFYDATSMRDAARVNRMRKVMQGINGIIRYLQRTEQDQHLRYELAESRTLRTAALRGDSPEWLGRLAREVAEQGAPDGPLLPTIWTPSSFEVGSQEGIGDHGIGVTLHETNYYTQRGALITELCRSDGYLRFNPIHFKEPEGKVLKLVHTAAPAAGIEYELPSRDMPFDFRAQAPRAYALGM